MYEKFKYCAQWEDLTFIQLGKKNSVILNKHHDRYHRLREVFMQIALQWMNINVASTTET